MNIQELLQHYPFKRIKPVAGMAVTADIWEEAHHYHHQRQSFLTLFSHGAGILNGLEVIASVPPDTSVYVLPGIAIDPAGQIIVLPQPVAYDLGRNIEGLLYLLIGYGESRPRTENGHQQEGAPLYIWNEFSISAQNILPDQRQVELARIYRTDQETVFHNARNPVQPGANEIDLRFRCEIGAPREIRVAVCYLGQVADKKHGRGATFLAQALNHTSRYRVWVEDEASIGPRLTNNTLIYLVGQGRFELAPDVMNGLHTYVRRQRGTLLIESLDTAAETTFTNFLREKEFLPEAIETSHPLLLQPHLFPAPPPGYAPPEKSQLKVNDGIIFSTYNYGLLWQGQRQDGPASRDEIRAAIEFGNNIISYVSSRRGQE